MLLRTARVITGTLTLDHVEAVFDLDGVLADSSWRDERDVSKCMMDPVINRNLIIENNYQTIVILTGREDCFWPETRGWLDNVLNPLIPWELDYLLLMRPTGDTTETGELKVRLLNNAFSTSYLEYGLERETMPFPLYDDNPKVIEAYQNCGWDAVHIQGRGK